MSSVSLEIVDKTRHCSMTSVSCLIQHCVFLIFSGYKMHRLSFITNGNLNSVLTPAYLQNNATAEDEVSQGGYGKQKPLPGFEGESVGFKDENRESAAGKCFDVKQFIMTAGA